MALPQIYFSSDCAVVLLTRRGIFEILFMSCDDSSFVPSHGEIINALLGSHRREKPRRVFSCLYLYQIPVFRSAAISA